MYGCDLLGAAIAYFILQGTIIRSQGENSLLAQALGKDLKGKISPILYSAGIVFTLVYVWLSVAIYVIVAMMWVIPDSRVENYLSAMDDENLN